MRPLLSNKPQRPDSGLRRSLANLLWGLLSGIGLLWVGIGVWDGSRHGLIRVLMIISGLVILNSAWRSHWQQYIVKQPAALEIILPADRRVRFLVHLASVAALAAGLVVLIKSERFLDTSLGALIVCLVLIFNFKLAQPPLTHKLRGMSGRFKRYGLNFLGVLLVGVGFVVAPIPGPGGTPLILAGLTILAINNPWAERWRDYLIEQHQSVARVIFRPDPKIRFLWDLIGAIIFAGGVTILNQSEALLVLVGGSTMVSLALLIWLTNHDRAARFLGHTRRLFSPKKPADGRKKIADKKADKKPPKPGSASGR